jgi:hypothetical protein
MFVIRLYLAGLTLIFLACVLVTRGIGRLEGVVTVCAVLYLILDMRAELSDLRLLEARVLSLPRG